MRYQDLFSATLAAVRAPASVPRPNIEAADPTNGTNPITPSADPAVERPPATCFAMDSESIASTINWRRFCSRPKTSALYDGRLAAWVFSPIILAQTPELHMVAR